MVSLCSRSVASFPISPLVTVAGECADASQLKNRAGRDAFAEALHAGEGKEEVAGWIEGYLFKTEGGGDDEPPDTEEASAGIATDGPAEEQKNETGEQPTFEAVAELAEQAGKVDLKDGQ